jgi:squalene-associated FAD-dependent desaturase
MMHVTVVGGGWAGLAAAATLCHQQIPVTLLEASKQLGGRARTIPDETWNIDNGQHIMLGSYHYTINLLKNFDIHERTVLQRSLLSLEIRSPEQESIRLQVPNVAAPMHLLWGIMRTQGLDLHERGTLLRLGARLIRGNFTIKQDQTLEKWLLQQGQTRRLINHVWQPLCLGLLNTPIREASTRVFLKLAKKIVSRDREDSDLLFIKPTLTECLPIYARRFIEQHDGTIQLKRRVNRLIIDKNKLKGIMVGDKFQPVDQLILATPPWVTQKLMGEHEATQEISELLDRLSYHPICTVYLQYPEKTRLEREFIGLTDSVGHWLFDHRINGQPGLMTVIICGPGKHMTMDNVSLVSQVREELAALFPHWPPAQKTRVIREKRATFGCVVDCDEMRPTALTGVRGLYLAGDYLNTGYPARLEGAVKSGTLSAKALMGIN